MKIFNSLFASLHAAISLMGIYAILIAIATFIENDYGTNAARAIIYDTWFFNILHLWLLVCLIAVIWRYRLLQQKKYASFILHFSFIIIIIGAGITRFFGHEGLMHIREGESSSLYTSNDNYLNLIVLDGENKYNLHIPTSISFASSKALDEKIIFGDKSFEIKSSSITKMNNNKSDPTSILKGVILYDGIEYPVTLIGGSQNAEDSVLDLNGVKLLINWGPRIIELPFSIKLDDFILERYPGSMSPSSYEAKVVVLDEKNNVEMPYHIYMNHTLDYGGFRFFQAHYDEDELGTILSVNNDPGKIPTYIGYFLLIVGSFWVIFAKNGRFRKLGKFLQSQSLYALVLVLLAISNTPMMAEDINKADNKAILDRLDKLRENSKEHAELFGRLQIQDYQGRIKPMDTLASELVHKVTKKDKFQNLSTMQVILGMLIYEQDWEKIKMIKISTPKLKQIIGVSKDDDYISFRDLHNEDNTYKLTNYVEEANRKKPAERGTFDKDLLSVDERLNIVYGIFSGQFIKIFPVPNHGQVWLSPLDIITFGDEETSINVRSILKSYFDGFKNGVENNDWSSANEALQKIADFQKTHTDQSIYLDENKLNAELLLNKINLFQQLMLPYLLVSILMFIAIFMCIFKPSDKLKKILRWLYYISALILLLHLFALLLRWYVAGHAPWSNAYESMLYIAFVSAVSGVVFFRKSYLAISASLFLAGMSLMVAHIGFMDPQIGNLVPVLKSYWLNIHVSVITASYGFLGLCFILGIVALILMIFRRFKSNKLDSAINSITIINEMSMIFGLLLLCVGNFLGGIWANESWGRYWGWDAKETWALVSIGVYAIILHLRFVCKENLQYIFSSASVIGFFSILMTYYGVNYYLSGLHSYAAGDPMPIPKFLYFMVAGVFAIVIAAFFTRKMEKIKI